MLCGLQVIGTSEALMVVLLKKWYTFFSIPDKKYAAKF